MPRGGLRNPPGGRPVGSKDKLPRGRKNYDEFKRMVYDAEQAEFLYTNDKKEFDGNALELMVTIYRAEQLPVKTRLYAASKAVEFEPRALPELQTDADREQETEAIWALIEQRQQFAIDETLHQLGRGRSSGAPAVIVEQVAERLRTAAQRETHISEISLPAPPRPVVRKREPVRIDESAIRHGCDMASESGTNAGLEAVQLITNPLHTANGQPVIVRTTPFREFYPGNKRVIADERGEIRVDDAATAALLLAAGCKVKVS